MECEGLEGTAMSCELNELCRTIEHTMNCSNSNKQATGTCARYNIAVRRHTLLQAVHTDTSSRVAATSTSLVRLVGRRPRQAAH